MTKYMTFPPPIPPRCDFLPVGTKIIFIKELSSGPDDFSPGNLYAPEGATGVVTGHGCYEGHWVKWDDWEAPFGAVCGIEFKELLDF
jgi:hypothetical protein